MNYSAGGISYRTVAAVSGHHGSHYKHLLLFWDIAAEMGEGIQELCLVPGIPERKSIQFKRKKVEL